MLTLHRDTWVPKDPGSSWESEFSRVQSPHKILTPHQTGTWVGVLLTESKSLVLVQSRVLGPNNTVLSPHRVLDLHGFLGPHRLLGHHSPVCPYKHTLKLKEHSCRFKIYTLKWSQGYRETFKSALLYFRDKLEN